LVVPCFDFLECLLLLEALGAQIIDARHVPIAVSVAGVETQPHEFFL
jgi:hypothetical protein